MHNKTLVSAIVFFACSVATLAQAGRNVIKATPASPAPAWPSVDPMKAGFVPQELEALYAEMTTDPHQDLKGVVILRDGRLVSEHYFNGDSVDTLHDIRSATKSITALLMGIAIQQHLVKSVNDSISDYLPGLPRDGKEKVTIKDLLNMRSGLDAYDDNPSSPGNEDTLDESQDWIKTVYAVPMRVQPGTVYVYCSLNAFLAGAIIQNASHIPLDQFAAANLFKPLGIETVSWRHVPPGYTTGQGNLYISTRDEAAIGELVLDGGMVGSRRIIDRHWIDTSLAPQVAITDGDPFANFYGYMWYSKEEMVGDRKIEVHFASGNGGNKIYVIPSLQIVVAITSSAYGRPYGQRRSQDILFRILAATQP